MSKIKSAKFYKRGVFVLVKKLPSGADSYITFKYKSRVAQTITPGFHLAIFNELQFANWYLASYKKELEKDIPSKGQILIMEILDQARWDFVRNKLFADGITIAVLNPCDSKTHQCPTYRFHLDDEADFNNLKEWFSKCPNEHYTLNGQKRDGTLLLLEKPIIKEKPKILMVEDDQFLCEIYKNKFKEAGFDIKVCEDGNNIVDRVLAEKSDIISNDIVHPGTTNGFEEIRLLKENERTRDIPIIIITNLGQKEEIEKGLKLGAEKYCLTTKYTPIELVEIFKNHLIKSGKFSDKDFIKRKRCQEYF